MTVLSAQTIRMLKILDPFSERTEFGGVTHGLSAAGYDLRLADDIEVYPRCSVLVDAMERFTMPLSVLGVLYTKSTWARKHMAVANTVIEPGWRGVLRLEISMHDGNGSIRIARGTGIAQVVFQWLDAPTEQPYPTNGKYQDQRPNTDAIFVGGRK